MSETLTKSISDQNPSRLGRAFRTGITAILLPAQVANTILPVNAAETRQDMPSCTTTVNQSFNSANLGRAFFLGATIIGALRVRNLADPVMLHFGPHSPHRFQVFPIGPEGSNNNRQCALVIDAINKHNGRNENLLHSFIGSPYDEYAPIDKPIVKMLDGVKYEIVIEKCERGNGTIKLKITQDLTHNPHSQCKKPENLTYRDTDLRSPIEWNMSGVVKEIPVGAPYIVVAKPGQKPQVGLENSTSREIGFSSSTGESFSSGVSFAFQATLQKEVGRADEAKFEQTQTRARYIELDPNYCNAWRVQDYNVVELGTATAPSMGVHSPIVFTVTLNNYPDVTALCKPGENTVSNEVIAAEKARALREYVRPSP